MKTNHLQKFIMMGKLFGYPECCVDDFLNRFNRPMTELMEEPPKKLHGTGFVPCMECHNTKTEKELIEIINKNRIFETPFSKDVHCNDDSVLSSLHRMING